MTNAEEFRRISRLPVSPNPKSDSANQLYALKDLNRHSYSSIRQQINLREGIIPADSVYEFDDKDPVTWWGKDTPGRQHWRKITWIKAFKEPINIEGDIELYSDLSQQDTLHRINQALVYKIKKILDDASSDDNILHLVYKIAWHPGGYKGKFCGYADSEACEAFNYIKARKQKDPCSSSPLVYHCVDEHSAFSEEEWKVIIHPPPQKKLNELTEGKSVVFLVAPRDKFKNNYSLVGFYTIARKQLKDGKVEALVADKKLSSKFGHLDTHLLKTSEEMLKTFGIEKWRNPRSTYEFINTKQALQALKLISKIHKE